MTFIDLRAIEGYAGCVEDQFVRDSIRKLVARVRELSALNVEAATAAMLARMGEQNERDSADRWREHAKVEYDLRGWLRLCTDDPAGHAEFYQWACHLYFGTPPPGDEDDEAVELERLRMAVMKAQENRTREYERPEADRDRRREVDDALTSAQDELVKYMDAMEQQ